MHINSKRIFIDKTSAEFFSRCILGFLIKFNRVIAIVKKPNSLINYPWERITLFLLINAIKLLDLIEEPII